MIKSNASHKDSQVERLNKKTQLQQLNALSMHGAGLSYWEAQELTNIIDEIFFQNSDMVTLRSGQMKYSCVAKSEPAGKPLDQCKMSTVRLTLFNKDDKQELPCKSKQASIDLRRRRLLRITEEASEQNGLLSQEDLAEILMCDVRTIRRDIAELKQIEIVVPTRGTIKDIGPGVTHKAIAIRNWLEGKEPTEVAKQIHHSLKATENYLEKFKRVAFLIQKGFTLSEMARTISISTAAVKTFKELYEEYKNKGLFNIRMEEINIVGHDFWQAEDEKKSSKMFKKFNIGK